MKSKSHVLFRRQRESSEPDHKFLATSRKRWRQRFLGPRNRPAIDAVLEVANAAA